VLTREPPAITACLLTLPLSVLFGILFPWADVVSIPAGIALFLIPEICVFMIILMLHFRIKVSLENRIVPSESGGAGE
jgi:hypothetical protein